MPSSGNRRLRRHSRPSRHPRTTSRRYNHRRSKQRWSKQRRAKQRRAKQSSNTSPLLSRPHTYRSSNEPPELDNDMLRMVLENVPGPTVTFNPPSGKIMMRPKNVAVWVADHEVPVMVTVGSSVRHVDVSKLINEHIETRPRLFMPADEGKSLKLKLHQGPETVRLKPKVPGFTGPFGLFITKINEHVFDPDKMGENMAQVLKDDERLSSTTYDATVTKVADDTVEFSINKRIYSVKAQNPRWMAYPRTTFRVRVGSTVGVNKHLPPNPIRAYLTVESTTAGESFYFINWSFSMEGQESNHEPEWNTK